MYGNNNCKDEAQKTHAGKRKPIWPCYEPKRHREKLLRHQCEPKRHREKLQRPRGK